MSLIAQQTNAPNLVGICRKFWQWWTGEIVALIPRSVSGWLVGRRPALMVTIDDECLTLSEQIGSRRRQLGDIDLLAASPATVAEITPRAAGDAILELPASATLRRVIALPAAAEANLAEVVSFELERYTPFRREEIYHAWRLQRCDPGQRLLFVEVTVAPRALVDDALARLGQIGIVAGKVAVAAESEGGSERPNLLSAVQSARTPFFLRIAIALLAVAAGTLGIAAAAVPVVQARWELAQLATALHSAKLEAADSSKLQREIEAALADRDFLAKRKHQVIPVSQLLANLTRLLPDDTWLSELRISGGELEISGNGASASTVVELIDAAPGLSNAAFRSPVVQSQQHREQFDIGARIDGAAR
jgi:general secretion pathway protein L